MKVLIADDEKWVRMTITSVIPFQQLGLHLVGEASNGIEALDMCKKYEPDILITDIRMPGLTGLELIQELRQVYPYIKIIIISGHSDFEYTKAAIKFGVSDYVLKPVNQSEITQVLQKVIDTIRDESRHKEEHKMLKDQYRATIPLMYDNVLNQLIVPSLLTADAMQGTLLKCGIRFDLPFYTVAVFSPDDLTVIRNNSCTIRFRAIIRRVVRKYLRGVTFTKPSADNEIIAIINHPASYDSFILNKAFELCCALFNKAFESTLSIGVSGPAQITKLPELYAQACDTLALRFWEGYGKTIYHSQNSIIENTSFYISEENMDRVVFGIKFLNIEAAQQCVESAVTHFRSRQYFKPDTIKEFFWNFIQTIITKLNMQMSFIEYVSSFSNLHPYEKIRNTVFMADLEAYMVELLQNICNHYSVRNPETNLNPVENAKRIIDQNYNNDISLEQVAKYIHLNPTYFSELFKKDLGMSFVDYKTNVRIENAKRLLQSTDMNIYEISSKIGYSDPKYFSKLFKKITGMTPFEYKESDKNRAT
ncbi:MAG: response regulator [Clostridia bacterium]|nr:response regulator [Clostridia bacterium]